jgi:Domain of unknown function (DUF1508)
MPDWPNIFYWFVYKDANHQWRWSFRAPNHRNIASSGEGHGAPFRGSLFDRPSRQST